MFCFSVRVSRPCILWITSERASLGMLARQFLFDCMKKTSTSPKGFLSLCGRTTPALHPRLRRRRPSSEPALVPAVSSTLSAGVSRRKQGSWWRLERPARLHPWPLLRRGRRHHGGSRSEPCRGALAPDEGGSSRRRVCGAHRSEIVGVVA